jgi:hypothetical protein
MMDIVAVVVMVPILIYWAILIKNIGSGKK